VLPYRLPPKKPRPPASRRYISKSIAQAKQFLSSFPDGGKHLRYPYFALARVSPVDPEFWDIVPVASSLAKELTL
jgi:hypothetical protein